jgi:hypothetical protein
MASGQIWGRSLLPRATLAPRRAAPRPTHPRTVFVLSGGRARGQAGMARVLLDAGVAGRHRRRLRRRHQRRASPSTHTPTAGTSRDLWRDLSTTGVIGGRRSWAWNVVRGGRGVPGQCAPPSGRAVGGPTSRVGHRAHRLSTHLATGHPVFHRRGPWSTSCSRRRRSGLFPPSTSTTPTASTPAPARRRRRHGDAALQYALELDPGHVWVLDVSAVRDRGVPPGSLDLVSTGFASRSAARWASATPGTTRVSTISLRMRPAGAQRPGLRPHRGPHRGRPAQAEARSPCAVSAAPDLISRPESLRSGLTPRCGGETGGGHFCSG